MQIYTDGSVLPMEGTNEIRSGIGVVVLKPRLKPVRISVPLDSETIERVEIIVFQQALFCLTSTSPTLVQQSNVFNTVNGVGAEVLDNTGLGACGLVSGVGSEGREA